MLKFGELLPGNSRDDKAHLRTYVYLYQAKIDLHTLIRRAAIQKCIVLKS